MRRKCFFAVVFVTALVLCCVDLKTSFVPRVGAQSALPQLALVSPFGGLSSPVGIINAADGSNRLFIVEQGGRIRVVKNGALLSTPFLDISTRISTGGERGLLGLAFPPGFTTKRHFYVYYTNPSGDLVIARYRVSSGNADVADASSEQVVITIPHPGQANHNGGQMVFGPQDGYLYAGTGDGGSAGDPPNNAQNTNVLLGKILRLDVETGDPTTYTVPPSNPFVGRTGFRPEIWAYGVRNPWRFSFDRQTGDLFIADVGQGNYEEIDFQPAASKGGENYGWRVMEGFHCYPPGTATCNQTGLTPPVLEYDHSAGDCSVTGGYVYRGSAFPRMQGLYFYGDFCTGRIWGLRRVSSAWQSTLLLDTSFNITAFGEDEGGNLYAASYSTGQVYSVVDTTPTPTPTPIPTPTPTGTPEIKFGSTAFVVPEQSGPATITVSRSGDPSPEVSVEYATSDGTASSRSDYTAAGGTLHFATGETQKTFLVLLTNDDTHEGDETLTVTLSNLVGGGVLEAQPSRTLTITDDDATTAAANPVDRADFFVRQHYHDFLNREPDDSGLQFWIQGIESCGADAGCREAKRVDTSAAFFLSIEFQQTGYLVYLLHKAAYGNVPGTPVPVRLSDFLRDTQEIGRGLAVGAPNWEQTLEANKRDFVNAFVERTAFTNAYPTGQTPTQFVNALNANSGFALTQAEVTDLAARLADGRETRATVLRRVAEDADFRAAEFNRAFVLMQYFGYLRRDPDASPDADFAGYNFWLTKLNDNGGDYRKAELVKAFLVSIEYRRRFKP
ncbi:MAG: PQQ-dependent sugar dehydrogenase [Pyrinomonadaceae bacterium]